MSAKAALWTVAPDRTGATRPADRATTVTVDRSAFADTVYRLHQEVTLPLDLVFVTDDRSADGTFGVHAILAVDRTHEWIEVTTKVPEDDPRYD